MKADRGALARAVADPPADLRLLLLHGPDEAGSRALADRYAAALGPGVERLDLLPADLRADPARLADEAAAISMFGGRMLIRVQGIGDESLAAVEALLEAPAAGNPVVATAGALRRDAKLLKLTESHAAALAFASYVPDARDFAALVGTLAQEAGLTLPRDLARRIAEAAGGDRAIAASEIDKLALYLDAAPDRPRPVSAADIDALSASIADSDLDRLVGALTLGRPAEVERQLARLAAEGASGIVVLRAAARRLHLLSEMRLDVDRGEPPASVVAARGKAVFWKDRDSFSTTLGQWTTPRLSAALARLLAAERAIKSPGSLGDLAADAVLLDLARPARGRA